MDTLNSEMQNMLNNLYNMFDKNNCEHLQLLIYIMYLNGNKDENINQMIQQCVLKIKNSNEENNCCKPVDISHPYPLKTNIKDRFVSTITEEFLNRIGEYYN